ncbi:MAG: chromate transporter [Xanthobacteraceae bacterium]
MNELDKTRDDSAREAATDPATSTPPVHRPSILELFVAFATISLYGFGGVLAWSRLMLVEKRKWMTPEEFNDAYALCQFLPGPNIVNLAVVFGRNIRGVPGALIALVGLIGPSMVIVTFFGFLYATYGEIDALRRMLTGVAAAAAGLIISVSAKMAHPLFEQRNWLVYGVAIATFVAVGIMRWPIWWVLGVLVPISIGIALRSRQ